MRILVLLIVLATSLWAAPAQAAPAEGPSERALQKDDDEKKDKDKGEDDDAEAKAAAEAEQKRKDRAPRVVVLKWPATDMKRGESADYQDETLIRNVRSRIDRADALFFPSVDLYQAGRKSPDNTLLPVSQPAVVDDGDIQDILSEVDRISRIPWNELNTQEWADEARLLRRELDKFWFVDRVEHREAIFMIYAQIGRAADNMGNQSPPFFEAIGGRSVNYYYYLAATLAWQDASLMNKLTDPDVRSPVDYLLGQLNSGGFQTFPLDFELDGDFDLETFEKEYTVLLNGLEVQLDESARVEVPLGITDIYLRRNDTGHGLSDRFSADKFEDKAYFVRDVARKRMGIEFIRQLMLHPNECSPELDGDILNFLAIYAKMHGKSEIYIAVPKNGSANKVFIWRYDRSNGTLQLVGGSGDDFPIYFVGTLNAGLLYHDASFSVNTDITSSDATDAGEGGVDVGTEAANRADIELPPARLPFTIELRAHYNRLMVAWGWEFGYGFEGYQERYWTPGHELMGLETSDLAVIEAGGDGSTEILRQTQWNRYNYGALGVVLGRDASFGIGPRFAGRFGWTNLPHAFQTTAHFGWTFENPLVRRPGKRVRPILDIDGRGGIVLAAQNSVLRESDRTISPIFGLTVGVGSTF